ncbi:matrixin family metalloprotease [Pseudarthrobacter sp. NamB4]|uniref:matrixin family metalloprotease n=1 Tax=Pseudarthrobacter sp. NamB4 TaxID=2576837 RepID=UPI0010FD3D50|nr:matrixin family metalloprotease [Pseudarthrobacter sp. NamB4]TLM74526.1 matrilysin family metalloendoprotease [Pseudarthrobacter sp. NamB4]
MTEEQYSAAPYLAAVHNTAPGESSPGFSKVQSYLERFGYLGPSTPREAGVLDNPTEGALRNFQEFFHLPVTGVFDDATREAMMRPRCGLPDMRGDIAFSTACAWADRTLTYAFDAGTDDVAGTAELDAIRRAIKTWQNLGGLTFTEVAVGSSPDIRIGWRPAADPDHSMVGGVLAHADFPPGCSVVTNTLPKPVHFDDSEHVWSVGAAPSAFDIETVALHEFGHIVGLAHSSVANAVMAPTVSSNFTKRALTQDDIDGFRALYPAAPDAWSGWNSLGGVITSDICVGNNKDGRMEAFARGTDGAVWRRWQTTPSGDWSGWNSLGGVITSEIGVASNLDGRLEIFVRGTDNALWHKWQTAPNGNWSGWNSLGGVITGPPATGRNADGRLEVFARGTDGAVWHRWQTSPSGNWAGWHSLGGVITSEIATGKNKDGRLEVFARGTDNALWHKWQTAPNGNWSGWESLGGILTSNTTIGTNADGRLEAFVRGTDNALWHKWQTAPNSGWSGWHSLGGILTSDIAAGRNASGRLEAFVRGTDNALWHMWQTAPNSGWSGWHSLGGILTSNITVGTNADGRLEAFVRGTDNAMWHRWQNRPFLTEESTGMAGAAVMGGDAGGEMSADGAVPQTAEMPSGAMDDAAAAGGQPQPAAQGMSGAAMEDSPKEQVAGLMPANGTHATV